MTGFVHLVGAGPGDPRLLTVRALELIETADVLAYDELVSQPILYLAPATAELLAVGRRAGDEPGSYRLHPAVLERARSGRRVVRLKAGDPFVFGRGGEEAEELVEAGIPFEVVPGVSAALGAAAYAGIPLTHRSLASGVSFRTGHEAVSRDAALDDTIVVYMAGNRLGETLDRLIADGRDPQTPAACVLSATRADQRVIVGTLADLAAKASARASGLPTLVIVGNVVSLRQKIAWFERQPLSGKRVLVARARPGPSEIAGRLRALGAVVVEAPVVHVEPRAASKTLRDSLKSSERCEAVIFACAAGVEAVDGADEVLLRESALFAVGTEAGRALDRRGLHPSHRLIGACPEALSPLTDRLRGSRVLLITGEGGRPSLIDDLEGLGAHVETLALYCYALSWPPLPRAIDLVVLPSSSAARQMLSHATYSTLRTVAMAAMGPCTAAAARAAGATRVVQSPRDGLDALIEVVVAQLAGDPELPAGRPSGTPAELERRS